MRTISVLLLVLMSGVLPVRAADRSLTPAERKAAFLKMLDRPKVEPDEKITKSETRDNFEYLWRSIAMEKKADGTIERLPFLSVASHDVKDGTKQRRLPVVIVMHGTGGSKDAMRSWLEEFAKLGFLAIAIDARYHGDRAGGAKGRDAYVAAITKAWKTPAGQPQEHPFFYDTCWDLWRLVDWLETQPNVDPKRIGMVGTSMGGIQCWLAASVDDRVKAAVPLIGVQSFRWSLDNDKWQGRARTIQPTHDVAAKDLGEKEVNQRVCRELWTKLIPGILEEFDGPQMLPLFAGRYLFIANGDQDPNCPIEGARIAIKAAEEAFRSTPEKLKVLVQEGVAHKVTDEMRKESIEFLLKALK